MDAVALQADTEANKGDDVAPGGVCRCLWQLRHYRWIQIALDEC